MPLRAGDHLGPYQIHAQIGAGGMGEVYRARDARLDRDVAIKVLPESFSADPDRVARFAREAKTLAALNHPNIAQVYDTGTSGASAYLVMELVEGQTLDEAVRAHAGHHTKSADVLEWALPIARQIAEGLEVAHERGMVHRDLKPANVKITPDGHVKILDFGLAKAIIPGSEDAGLQGTAGLHLANSPTLTARATEAGVILGTAAYMSPEQARGKTVDKRTDIWAFGAVLYEMLTSHRAFDGETVSDTLASVLRSEPDWEALPAGTPPHVGALIRRCLERDQSRRLRDIGEARLALETGQAPAAARVAASGPLPASSVASSRRPPYVWIGATVFFAALAGVALWQSPRQRRTSAVPSFELAVAPPPGAEFAIGSNSGNVIVSPDGSKIAFAASTAKAQLIWVRSLGENDAKPLSGTDGASYPFWSADGRKIGFFADGRLKTIEIAGGLPEVIAEAENGRGGSWSDSDTIIFTPQGGGSIARVSARGGAVAPLTKLDISRGENAHYWPTFLPDGRAFLYFVRSTSPENSGIYLARLDGSRPATRLVASLSAGLPVVRPSTGQLYLIWARDHDLLAQPLDAVNATLRGEAVTIGHDVRVEESQRLAFVGASRTGTLAWASARAAEVQLGLYARDGRRIRALDVPPGVVLQPALSPDGRRLLFIRVDKGNADIYLYEMESGVSRRLTTNPDYDESPAWTPDGRAFVYSASEKGATRIRRMSPDDGAAPARLFEARTSTTGLQTADGRFVLTTRLSPAGGTDVVAQPIGGGSTSPVTLATIPESAFLVSLTQDGRWLLLSYGSSGSIARLHTEGATPTLGARISLTGGGPLQLRADGKEAYIATPDGTLKAVALTIGADTISPGAVTTLFRRNSFSDGFSANATGTEFVLVDAPFEPGQAITVLTNWDARIK